MVEIERFERFNYADFKHFYERVFTPKEIQYCLSFREPAPHFAANFAGKEAVYKAIHKHLHMVLRRIEILRDGTGAPRVNLYSTPGTRDRESFAVKVSLSHSSSHAAAIALVYPDLR